SGGVFLAEGAQGATLRNLHVVAAAANKGPDGATAAVAFPAASQLDGPSQSIDDKVCANLCGDGATTTGGGGGYKKAGNDGTPSYGGEGGGAGDRAPPPAGG